GRGAERPHEQLVAVAARWVDPDRRDGPLVPYARDAEARSLELLDAALDHRPPARLPETIEHRLRAAAAADVSELRPRLQQRADEEGARAGEQLRERGAHESLRLREILEAQRDRVQAELRRHEGGFEQLTLGFGDEERRQLEQDVRSWRQRLVQFDADLATEPDRIADFYVVRARRLEPVGLVYLWPDTN
ncbi:MAG: DISARM system SNF2-like helicase DrmD, partial [Solirubrobacteraceae bacterium]